MSRAVSSSVSRTVSRLGLLGALWVVGCFAGSCAPVEAAFEGSDRDSDGIGHFDDCDDRNPSVGPDQDEVCDGVDNDCDGEIDGTLALGATVWYLDADGDGAGWEDDRVAGCAPPSGYVAQPDDCDDDDADVSPSAIEICDDKDNDCDGQIDEYEAADAQRWYQDRDGDGFGDLRTALRACDRPAGFLRRAGDCRDLDPLSAPGLPELCDGIDNDCDGVADRGAPGATFQWPDADGDGFGRQFSGSWVCGTPRGFADNNGDCDDTDRLVNPRRREVCGNGRDDDCDNRVDEGC